MRRSAGDSTEQRRAEHVLIASLSRRLGVRLRPHRLELRPRGLGWLELDGYSESPLVLCEAWAHIGSPKSAQVAKVMKDALKLLYVSKLRKGKGRRILLFADRAAAGFFQDRGWMAQCLRAYRIEVVVASLPPGFRVGIKKAQKRQYR